MESNEGIIPARELVRQGRRPAILHFRPTGFRKVESPEALQRWERLVIERVGFHPNIDPSGAIVYYETTCGTGDFDDCAEEDPGEQPSD